MDTELGKHLTLKRISFIEIYFERLLIIDSNGGGAKGCQSSY